MIKVPIRAWGAVICLFTMLNTMLTGLKIWIAAADSAMVR